MPSLIKHISTSIEGALRRHEGKSMHGYLLDENGNACTDKEVRDHLQECLSKGWKLLPAAQCEGFDHFGGGCPGHEVKEEV